MSPSTAASVRPLFTTLPLSHPSSSSPSRSQSPHKSTAFVSSPMSTYHGHSPSLRLASLPSHADEPLTFPKLSLSASCSTDSEAHHSSSEMPPPCSSGYTSPSLLTCLFQDRRQGSTESSASASSKDNTPVTPSSSNMVAPTANTACGKPILRRGTASGHTSASEDNVSSSWAGYGLGFCGFTQLPPTASASACSPTQQGGAAEKTLQRKPSCISFAVKTPSRAMTSDSASSSVMFTAGRTRSTSKVFARSPAKLPSCRDDEIEEDEDEDEGEDEEGPRRSFLDGEASESDDEGYQEDDEEGGFTSDDDDGGLGLLGALPPRLSRSSQPVSCSPSSDESWAMAQPFSGPSSPSSIASSSSRPAAVKGGEKRGRRISIACPSTTTSSRDRCSRHRSPPPPLHLDLPGSLGPAPPAARSPSALGLCRRRASKPSTSTFQAQQRAGFRSDDSHPQSMSVSMAKSYARTASLPLAQQQQQPCKSILRRSPRREAEVGPSGLLRRGSEPLCGGVEAEVVLGRSGGEGAEGCERELKRVLGQGRR